MTLSIIGTRDLAVLSPAASVTDAVRMMGERGVGSILVSEDDKLVGILTDRDLVLRVLAEARDPRAVRLAEIMSAPVVTVRDDTSIDDAAWRMREHAVRRLPITDAAGSALGIVTLDDILGHVGGRRGDVAEILASFHAPSQVV